MRLYRINLAQNAVIDAELDDLLGGELFKCGLRWMVIVVSERQVVVKCSFGMGEIIHTYYRSLIDVLVELNARRPNEAVGY